MGDSFDDCKPGPFKQWSINSKPLTIELLQEMSELIAAHKPAPPATFLVPICVDSLIAKDLPELGLRRSDDRAMLHGFPVVIDDRVGLTYAGRDVLCWLAGDRMVVHPQRKAAFDACWKKE